MSNGEGLNKNSQTRKCIKDFINHNFVHHATYAYHAHNLQRRNVMSHSTTYNVQKM